MASLVYITVAAVLTLLTLLLRVGPPARAAFAWVVAGDEDMKIASPGAFRPKRTAEEASDREAEQFLRLKRAGDVEAARHLGERFASVLLEKDAMLRDSVLAVEDPLRMHQQLVLYTYAVNRAISDLAPHSILAQTSLSVFYSELEDTSAQLYRQVSDMAAFSLYILCERKAGCSDEEIGHIYAGLCDGAGDENLIREGNALYQRFYAFCLEEHRKIEYSVV